MRVLVYGLNAAPELIGVGKYSGELSTWLARAGHQIRMVCAPPYYPGWKVHDGHSALKWRSEDLGGVTLYRCPLYVPERPSGLKRLLHLASFAVTSLPVILCQALFWRPDVIIVALPTLFTLPGAVMAKGLALCPAWVHIQDFEVDAAFQLGLLKGGALRRFGTAMEGFLLRRFERATTISTKMCDRLGDKGISAGRIGLLPNWVDTDVIRPLEEISPLRKELEITAETVVALYSGNMNEKQGIEVLIDAAHRTETKAPVLFVLAGDGAARPRLEAMAVGMKNIRFLPLQPMERLNDLLNMADIHLLPQMAGAADLVMPSKLTGMLASGRPVIAGADPGTQIANTVASCGVVVAPEDSCAMAHAISGLANHKAQRRELGGAARGLAVKEWRKAEILSRLETDLLQLIDTTSRR